MRFPRTGLERKRVLSAKFGADFPEGLGEERVKPGIIGAGEVECGPYAEPDEYVGRARADAPDVADGQLREVGGDFPVRNGGKAVRLLPFRSGLGEDLGRGEPDRERGAEKGSSTFLWPTFFPETRF